MEYFGSVSSRKVDKKRRIMWPAKLANKDDKHGFCFLREDESVRIYPYLTWKVVMKSFVQNPEKIAWAKKSTLVIHLDAQKRLLLPKEWTGCKCVDLIGVGDYLIIRESTDNVINTVIGKSAV